MFEDLYRTVPGRAVACIIACPAISKAAGVFLDSGLSKYAIKRFVNKNGIDLSDVEKTDFRSFNEFFTRTLKPGSRPLGEGLISPCDGLLSVYRIDENCRFKVKGSVYTPKLLTCDEQLNADFKDGYCLVFRLTPSHYHRYIFPASGKVVMSKRIKGIFHTVRPIALEHVPVFVTNTREYTVCDTDSYGRVMQMEVGAAMVGRITNADFDGRRIIKGQEKGCFEFGGSTIIMFIQKDACTLRDDILKTGETEMNIRMGERIDV